MLTVLYLSELKMKIDSNDFYERVYSVVEQIPAGKVTTYGAIAGYLGVVSGARMVGYALNNLLNRSDGEKWPAHRVVNKQGELTGRGYFRGDTMRERLQQEGIEFSDEYTINITRHFWDPNEECEK